LDSLIPKRLSATANFHLSTPVSQLPATHARSLSACSDVRLGGGGGLSKSHANFNTSIKKYLIKIDEPIHYSIKKNPNFMTLFATSTTSLQ
jgi:hypothetical protein